jgi:Predicted transcriptional regulator
MQQLKLFQEHLPKKSRSCDDFDVDNKVRYITEAIKKRYIQPNDFNSTQWLVFDIDRPVCPDSIRNDNLAPEPTVFVRNPKNGHAHLFYLLKTPVHKNSHSSQKALQFAAAVEYGLAIKLDADMGYVGLLAKNALHADWEVLHTVPQAYELHELAESVDTTVLNTPLKQRLEYGLHRNVTMFDEVSKWAYKAIRQGWPDYNQWHKAVLSRTEMLNRQLKKPMDYAEYKHIAKSIAKWTHAKFSKQGFAEWQSNNGKRSGEARAKKNEDKRIQAHQMRSNGLKQQAIAEALGVSQSTIAKWLKK